jgi:hypothetical protein
MLKNICQRRQHMTIEIKENIKALFVKLEKIRDYL